MNFSEIVKAFNEVAGISSTNERIDWLKNHDDEDFKEILKWYLDTSRITGIAEKKYDKVPAIHPELETQDCKTFSDVIRYFDFHKSGRDEDVAYIKHVGEQICATPEEEKVFRALVCKNFPMGLKEGLVNKAFPGLVPVYEVMLADRYYDLNESQKAKIFKPGRKFVLQEKLDGFRLTVRKENGAVRCISRQGKLIEGLVDIEEDARKIPLNSFELDGEVLLIDRANIPSKLQYKATSKIVSTKDKEKHGVMLNAFDIVPLYEWDGQLDTDPYSQRYADLAEATKDCEFIKAVPNLYEGDDVSVIDTMIVEAKAKEWEGLMVRFCDSKYAWKRSKDLLKVKPFKEMDVYITGYEEGTNSNAGKLGAFLCEIDHPQYGNLKFKVGGGFSDDERFNFWEDKDELIGRIISVQYFEVTQNTTTGQYSVRFPEFLELKEEGSKINN